MRRLLPTLVAVSMLGVLSDRSATAFDLLGDLKKIFEGHAIEVSAINRSQQTLYVYIDDTGRHDPKVKMDAAKLADGKDLPPGLIYKPGQDRTFGESIGAGDVPTIHVFILNAQGVAVGEKAAKKFGPDDYGKKVLEIKRPVIRLEITDNDITSK